MRYRAALPLLLMLMAAATSGCGLRGPLYLPESASRTTEAGQPAPAETAEEAKTPATSQPAPQAQKRDRSGTTTEPASTPAP
jgi:predicted small lipoprotein YifL